MTQMITGLFDTRREAEMAVERLVQEYEMDRSRITAHAAGEDNTSGTVVSGADAAAGEAPEGVRQGRIAVRAEVEADRLDRALEAFRTCGAKSISQGKAGQDEAGQDQAEAAA